MDKKLRVAILSSASGGGAGIAARRVADALNLRDDVVADFLDIAALGEPIPDDAAPLRNMSNEKVTDTHFTVEYPGFVRGWLVDLLDRYDVINVHWASYLIGLAELDELCRRGKPMLFTLHDYYYITGGCHYPAGCSRFQNLCSWCPQVDRDGCDPRATLLNHKLKRILFARPNVRLSAPSRFLVSEALKANIVPSDRAHVLRNPYHPITPISRKKKTSKVSQIILIADCFSERRKGMALAMDVLSEVAAQLERQSDLPKLKVELIGQCDSTITDRLEKGCVPYVRHGKISDHRELARLFCESDFVLTCSNEDNWPNVLVEAGAYGCIPIVGPGHGCEEFVKSFSVGFIASGYQKQDFSEAVISALSAGEVGEREAFSDAVREKHQPEVIAAEYAQVLRLANVADILSKVS